VALLPIFARDVLGMGPEGLGLLRSAPAAGALITSIVLARMTIKDNVGKTFFIAVGMFGFATAVFGMSTNLWLSMAALAVVGASDVVSVVIRSSLVQMGTPDALRGRVSSANSMFIGTSNQLGEFRAGAVAAMFGAVPAVIFGGLLTVAFASTWMFLFPELRKVRKLYD
jgi:MFS family permease